MKPNLRETCQQCGQEFLALILAVRYCKACWSNVLVVDFKVKR